MKLYELVQARTIISNHIDQNQPLSASLAYKVMKLIKNTQNDYDFYQEKFRDIIQDCSEKDENGQIVQENNGIKVQEGKMEECSNRITELNETEVEMPNIKFTIDELSGYDFSIMDMAKLDDFIKE